MGIFTLSYDELIFSIFLPFLFFFLLTYALLKKSQILGEQARRLNLILAMVISALGIFSLYSFGLTTWLPFLAAFLIVASFLLIFGFGVGSYALKKVAFFYEEEDMKKFEEGVKKCQEIYNELSKTKDDAERLKLFGKLESEIERLKPIANKLGKNIKDFEWYKRYEEIKAIEATK